MLEKKGIQIVRRILLIVALIIIIFIFYKLVRNIFQGIGSINPNIAAAIVAALAALFGVLYNQRQNKIRDIQETHRPEKVKLYKDFMDYTTNILISTKRNELKENDPEIERFFFDFAKGLIIWGSPNVIIKYHEYKLSSSRGEGVKFLLYVDDLLQAIRKDLKNSNRGLNRGDLIKVFLRDPSELD